MKLRSRLSKFNRQLDYTMNGIFRVFSPRPIPGIAILGCGRSGTTYTSELFKQYGYRVGHERLLLHGISSWLLTSDQEKVLWGPSRSEIVRLGLPLVHQVRDPLKVISSCQATSQQSWDFLAAEISIARDDSTVLKGMKYWYYWNLKSEQLASFTYRVEELDTIFPQLCQIGSFEMKNLMGSQVDALEKNVNTRRHSQLSWKDIELEDYALASKIRDLAIRYGYEIA